MTSLPSTCSASQAEKCYARWSPAHPHGFNVPIQAPGPSYSWDHLQYAAIAGGLASLGNRLYS